MQGGRGEGPSPVTARGRAVPGAGPAAGPDREWQVAECLLPGLSLATAEALGHRLRQELAGLCGQHVAFLGSLLMPEDEVLLCLFTGTEAEVRAVSERAGLPFERILGCVGIGWAVVAEGRHR